MDGLVSGLTRLAVATRTFLGTSSWGTALRDYFAGVAQAHALLLYPSSGIVGRPVVPAVTGAPGSRAFNLPAGTYRATVGGQVFTFANTDPGFVDVPYPEGTLQYLGVHVAEYPAAVEASETGVIAVKHWATGVGHTTAPSAVTDNGDGTMKITTGFPTWNKAAGTRPVVAWLANPATDSSEALYTGMAVLSGGQIVINVPHLFGQVSASTTPADYLFHIQGPYVHSSAPDTAVWATIGTVNGATVSIEGQTPLADLGGAASLPAEYVGIGDTDTGNYVVNLVETVTHPCLSVYYTLQGYGAGLYRMTLQAPPGRTKLPEVTFTIQVATGGMQPIFNVAPTLMVWNASGELTTCEILIRTWNDTTKVWDTAELPAGIRLILRIKVLPE